MTDDLSTDRSTQALVKMQLPWRPMTLLFLGLVTTDPARSQERPLSIGGHIGADVSSFSHPAQPRIGAQLSVAVIGPIEFYPAVDLVLDEGNWQLMLNARAIPFRGSRFFSLWYLGAGVAFREADFGEALLTGFGWPGMQARPFVEFRLLGELHHLDSAVLQMLLGVRKRLR